MTKRILPKQPAGGPDPEPPAHRPHPALRFLERYGVLLSIAFVAVGSLRIAATYTVFNHTIDEGGHIASGMEWLDKGTYSLDKLHPPLARVAEALGPYLLGVRSQNTPRGIPDAVWREGLAILNSGGHYDRILAAARAGVLPFFWVAAATVFLWAQRAFGNATAALAVLLFTFEPTILAHSGLTTTDMALTAFLGAAFVAGLIWAEKPTQTNSALLGACLGLMVLSKYSSLVFFPASAALAFALYLLAARPGAKALAKAAGPLARSMAIVIPIASLVIWAGYRFSVGPIDLLGFSLPAPELFQGIAIVRQHNSLGNLSYLLGQLSQTGYWYFFPVALAVKTPLGFLGLLGIGAAYSVKTRKPAALMPLTFSTAVLLTGMASQITIGTRHVLPVFVGFSITAAYGLAKCLEGRFSWRSGLAVAFAGWFLLSSAAAHPDYLAYFNEIAAGQPENFLVDSDLDWAQDMKRLGPRLKELHVDHLTFTPFLGDSDFQKHFQLPPTTLEDPVTPAPGWNAVSLTPWKEGWEATRGSLAPWPDQATPRERVGRSILLYYFRPDDPLVRRNAPAR